MIDMKPNSDAGDDSDDSLGTPRWVYVFGIVAVVLIVLFVAKHLAGGGLGNHAP